MRICRTALEFRVELAGDKIRMFRLRKLDDLNEFAVGGESADFQPGRNKRGPPVAVVCQLVAVAMTLGDYSCRHFRFDRINGIIRIGDLG